MREEVELLEHHPRVDPELADLLALPVRWPPTSRIPPTSMSLGRILEEVHAAQQGGLPRSRPAEDHDDLALVDLHVDALEHLEVPEGLMKVLDADDGLAIRQSSTALTRRGAGIPIIRRRHRARLGCDADPCNRCGLVTLRGSAPPLHATT